MKLDFFESVEVSDVGRKRQNNEDACLRLPDQGVYCVADGMGGVVGGDLASKAIITSIQKAFSDHPQSEQDPLSSRVSLLRRAINEASRWIRNFAEEKVIGQMGSTVVALVFQPNNPTRAVALHAGDSRLHCFRGGELKVLTADHSVVAVLAAKLGRDPDTLPAKYQNELLRAVGLTDKVELERTPIEVKSGDLFLLCSDGLSRMLPNAAIAMILQRAEKEPLSSVAKALIDAANEAGGKDNITAVLVKIGNLAGLPLLPIPEEEPEAADEQDASFAADTGFTVSPRDDMLTMFDTTDSMQGETPHTDDRSPRGGVPPPAPGRGPGFRPDRTP